MAKKILKWIDERSVLRFEGKNYPAGSIIPAGALTKDRIKLFLKLKRIESVIPEIKDTGEEKDGDSSSG